MKFQIRMTIRLSGMADFVPEPLSTIMTLLLNYKLDGR